MSYMLFDLVLIRQAHMFMTISIACGAIVLENDLLVT